MHFLKSQVGRKMVMAASGMAMITFVVVHLLGNTTIFAGPDGINAYAALLHRFPVLLWAFRAVLLAMLCLHVFFGIQLKLENSAARPQSYAVSRDMAATFAGKTMIWTGLLIGVFIVYHLLHFTFQVTDPGSAARSHPDALGRPDVYAMVVLGLRKVWISVGYIIAMTGLALHLSHSIQSSLQTAGLHGEGTFPLIMKAGTAIAVVIGIGFVAFPLAVLAGWVR